MSIKFSKQLLKIEAVACIKYWIDTLSFRPGWILISHFYFFARERRVFKCSPTPIWFEKKRGMMSFHFAQTGALWLGWMHRKNKFCQILTQTVSLQDANPDLKKKKSCLVQRIKKHHMTALSFLHPILQVHQLCQDFTEPAFFRFDLIWCSTFENTVKDTMQYKRVQKRVVRKSTLPHCTKRPPILHWIDPKCLILANVLSKWPGCFKWCRQWVITEGRSRGNGCIWKHITPANTDLWKTAGWIGMDWNGPACVVRLDLKGLTERAHLTINSAALLQRKSIK